jgi:PAS domain S-box-containing protein
MIAALGNILLIIGRYFYNYGTVSISIHLMSGSALFLIPIVFNRYGLINLGRIALSWLPPLFVFYGFWVIISSATVQESSTFVGIRYLILATGCFSFLVFDLRNLKMLLLGLSVPLILIVFLDPLLNLFNVGYTQVGLHEQAYSFNNVRVLVSFLVLASSFIFLKRLNERNEKLNETLIQNLAKKNRLIQDQADHKLHQLNRQLKDNLEQLHEREFILNESQRVARIGSWEYTVKDRHLFWSQGMYNIFELDSQYQINPDSLTEFVLEDHRPILNSAIAKLLTSGEPLDFIVQARTPLGHIKWLRIYAYPIGDKNKPVGARGVCHDITYYKEAEELLRASENNYRTLFEQASDAIMIMDSQGNFKDMNASVVNMLGYSKSDLLQRNVSELLDPDELREYPLEFDQLMPGEKFFSVRRAIHRNGSIRIVESNLKKIGPDTIMAVSRDTTELRKAQREIKDSEARFRSAFEDSAIGMALVALSGQWLKVNRQLCQITGYDSDELLNMTYQDITHPDDHEKDAKIVRTMQEGVTENIQIHKRYIHKEGQTVWVNLNVSIVRDSYGKPLYLVAQMEDITELKRVEREKEQAYHHLNERIKELTTLYKTSQILNHSNKTIPQALKEIVKLLPSGWQHTEVCAARIVVGNDVYTSANFSESGQKQQAQFRTHFGVDGSVEVVYLEDKPIEVEGPFLAEERDLINMIAEMLRIYFVQKHEAEALSRSEANLTATINNSETMIWSVDRDLNILTFNQPFYEHSLKTYGVRITQGVSHYSLREDFLQQDPTGRVFDYWVDLYNRALNGETINVESSRAERIFIFSLSPIIEGDSVIGASVFAHDVTEQKNQEIQLNEANKKIGELKLMALRSVMSPHFIFNVLNSIQYYIATNDRVNAINYLSTFSKLIRNVLTHSVDNRIKLSDELDLLKTYVMLELTRFENKFDFRLEVDPEIDVDSITIPSLLIQPYVENAILHGLYTKMEKGTLTLKVTLEETEKVIFEIEDDGIGREAARKLRAKNFSSHKSMGINLTEERLRLITKSNETAVQIEDVTNNGCAAGTKVRIKVKYELD